MMDNQKFNTQIYETQLNNRLLVYVANYVQLLKIIKKNNTLSSDLIALKKNKMIMFLIFEKGSD